MNLKYFLSLNILSLSAYLNILMTIYVFCLESVFKIPPKIYITLEDLSNFYAYYFIFVIICLCFFAIEHFLKKRKPKLQTKFTYKHFEKLHSYLFYAGLATVLLFMILFLCLIIILIL